MYNIVCSKLAFPLPRRAIEASLSLPPAPAPPAPPAAVPGGEGAEQLRRALELSSREEEATRRRREEEQRQLEEALRLSLLDA